MGEKSRMKKVIFFTDSTKLHEALKHFDIQDFADKKIPVKLHMGESKNKYFSRHKLYYDYHKTDFSVETDYKGYAIKEQDLMLLQSVKYPDGKLVEYEYESFEVNYKNMVAEEDHYRLYYIDEKKNYYYSSYRLKTKKINNVERYSYNYSTPHYYALNAKKK